MEPLPVTLSGNPSDDYVKAPPDLFVLENGGRVERTAFYRTGITPPGYPDRAVYRAYPRMGLDGYYVLENGQLWEVDEWYQEHG